jgi:ATP-dependent Lhr-like helicase
VRDILIQAMLDAPVFPTRWRWNATRALAVLRHRGGRKVPAPLQRMDADDLMAAVFPDQAACLENIVGDREIPDHPLVNQTIEDCLVEAMDLPGLTRVLEGMAAGKFQLVARDTPEPSPISHEVLNARPYAFLDDAPLEERRTRAVVTRRSLDVKAADDLGTLDPAAIERVREEAQPDPRNGDELHDALMVFGALPPREEWKGFLDELIASGRASLCRSQDQTALWVATEKVPLVQAVFPSARFEPVVTVPEREKAKTWTREAAILELIRGQMEVAGPVTSPVHARRLGLEEGDVDMALAELEGEGFVLRGRFTPGTEEREWCERRLLARIHRYTLDRLRREIEPVSAADFMRFLFRWQRVAPDTQAQGPEGLAAVLELLDGCELAAGAWESDVLPSRVNEYDPLWLDALCLSGEIGWARLTPTLPMNEDGRRAGPIRSTPISLFHRENAACWRSLEPERVSGPVPLSAAAAAVLRALQSHGATFFAELVRTAGLLRTEVENGLSELVAWGLVSSDSFAGLRALLIPSERRSPIAGARRRSGRVAPFGVETAGRWAIVREAAGTGETVASPVIAADEAVEALARQLLRRYGVVFRRLLEREAILPPWRDLIRVFWRLEARGEIRGGRFLGGFSGEQFALPEAIGLLRGVRRTHDQSELVAVSGADPLNLIGIITPGETVPALTTNRVLFRDGVPVAVSEGRGQKERLLVEATPEEALELRRALIRRRTSPLVRRYLGKSRSGAA